MMNLPANTHSVLAGAMRAASRADWPNRVHLNGPRPVVTTRGMARITTRCADRVRAQLVGDERVVRDQILELCQRSLSNDNVPVEQIALAARAGLNEPSAFSLVARAALACWYAQQGPDSPTLGLAVCTDTVQRLVNLMRSEGQRAVDFLEELDDQLMIDEVETAIAKYGSEPIRVKKVLWRKDRGNGTAGHFLCELAAGDYGVITKLKQRYRFERGPLDDMLSVLPEALFVEAVEAVY